MADEVREQQERGLCFNSGYALPNPTVTILRDTTKLLDN
jgi:hypothetical protein